ncbi:MAG: hypothetical protein ACTSWY_04425 [Promethearchaeota archaeon]
MGIEKAEYTENALLYAKNKYNLSPALVTCDFSPNMTGPVKKVFGEETLQIDGFYVMQLLNNGIRRDVKDFRKKTYQNEINSFYQLRDWIKKIQIARRSMKQIKTLPLFPKIDKNHISCNMAVKITRKFVNLLSISSIHDFTQYTNELLSARMVVDPVTLQEFYNNLQKKTA